MMKQSQCGLILSCLVIIAAEALVSGCAAPRPVYEQAAMTARTGSWHDINSGKGASAVVAVMENGRIVYAEGFGAADREKSIPVGENTLFNIGSISKVYCAAAVMLLVDEGKIGLDDPVTLYLPNFVMKDERYRKITVRMLLNHTSGLPGGTYANSFGYETNSDVFKDTLNNLARSHLKHAPGEMAVYCNEGFTLAEMIVERVSGRKFIDFLAERIFRPLSLNHTGLSVGERPGAIASAYYQAETAKREPLEVISILGAGGLSASVVDLCLFADTFSREGNRIFSPAALAEMRKAQPPAFFGRLRNPDLEFGLGWDLTALPQYQAQGLQVLGKSGGTPNYTSMIYTVPEHRISTAAIVSGPGSSAMLTALKVLHDVLVEKGLAAAEEPAVAVPVKPETIPAELAAYAGYYINDTGLVRMSFDLEADTVGGLKVVGGEEEPMLSLVYNGGYFHDKTGKSHYFITIDGREYFVSKSDILKVDGIAFEKLPAIDEPLEVKIDVNGKFWTRRNVKPFEGLVGVETHLVKSGVIEALPGYVDFLGMKAVTAPDFAGMACRAIRDQRELLLFEQDNQAWAWVSDMLFSPAESAGALSAGENTVSIGAEGYSEWLKSEADIVCSIRMPEKGRAIVFTPDGQASYDSAVDAGKAFVAEGGWVELAGRAGDNFVIAAAAAY